MNREFGNHLVRLFSDSCSGTGALMNMRSIFHAACMLVAMMSAAQAQQAEAPPPGVIVETVKAIDMTVPEQFPGQIYAPMKIDVLTAASGALGPKQVKDGSLVKKNDLLFTIDKTNYQAAVAQAQAKLDAAQVAADEAQTQFNRTSDLVSKGTLPKAQFDTDNAALKVAQANVKVAQADLQVAQLALDQTDVKAPFDGRIGEAKFAEGAMVGPTSGSLAVLMSLDPMRVRFYVRQRALLEARKKYGDNVGQLVLSIMLADGSLHDQQGRLLFTDVEANASTDSVSVVGEVANAGLHLLDGQLVTVLLSRAEPDMQLAVTQAAVMLDQSGSHVLTVDKDNKVQVAQVTLGARKADKVAVTAGLKAGDRVIVAGMQKVAPGMVVAPTEQPAVGTETKQ